MVKNAWPSSGMEYRESVQQHDEATRGLPAKIKPLTRRPRPHLFLLGRMRKLGVDAGWVNVLQMRFPYERLISIITGFTEISGGTIR